MLVPGFMFSFLFACSFCLFVFLYSLRVELCIELILIFHLKTEIGYTLLPWFIFVCFLFHIVESYC